ncbi:MAG: ParB/RepB/Spo0J family partition protein [Actinomycetota bacterium]|nr:ParB/RepB/Spo0J family partition protein [Actinomycetota bacterium]
MVRKPGLGRGLGSLIPQSETESRDATYREIPTTHIRPNPNQPRKSFDEETLAALAASVASMGVIQPILVREHEDGQYEIIAGERRWRAARRVGLDFIPAIVQSADAKVSIEQALVENLHREDLNPIEEATAYQSLVEEFGFTHESLASRIGKSRAVITNALRLLQLPAAAQRLLIERRISAGHARALLSTPDRLAQERLARLAADEGLSVRALEELIKKESGAGDSDTPVTAPPRTTPIFKPAGIVELERLLTDVLDAKVQVQMGKKSSPTASGKVTIEFDNLEDLKRIAEQIASRSTL